MRYSLFTYAILLSTLIACKPVSIDEEKSKLAGLEQKINEQFDSLNIVSHEQLLQLEDSINVLSQQFQSNKHDSISIVFSKHILRNFEHLALRLQYFRDYRDTLKYELDFSSQQVKNLTRDLENRVWKKEQFQIYYVQETKSIHKSGKRIEENNKLIREDLKNYSEYEKKIRAAINDQKNHLSSTVKK